jgi:hypothetical protein
MGCMGCNPPYPGHVEHLMESNNRSSAQENYHDR